MLIIGILLATVFLMWLSVCFRLAVLHPIATVCYSIKDIYLYFRHRNYNKYDGGLLNCYAAHFGGGKTLSATAYVQKLYQRYNNKKIWDRNRKAFVLQKVHIISNVHLANVPYEELNSLSQVVCCAWKNKKIDQKRKTQTVVLVLLDEASSQLNSRNFKTNIDPDFLNTLVTSRHFQMSIFYTSQKFKLVDALLRNVTQKVINCNKVWRFMVQNHYDADEMEYATNPTLIKPLYRTGFFVKDKYYNGYDTLATVDKLKKSVDAGEMLSEEEILRNRNASNPDIDVLNPSRKLKRMIKRKG